MNLHPNQHPLLTATDKRIDGAVCLATNLYNTGLTHPECAIAYRAAMSVGAGSELAWEAAREHFVFRLRENQRVMQGAGRRAADRDPLMFGGRNCYGELTGDAARQVEIDRVLALVNPFRLERAA